MALTGSMVDTEVTVAVYDDTGTQPFGTACVDLVEVMVPAYAMEDVAWKPAPCIFDLRTWNRVHFKERDGVWFMYTVEVLLALGDEPATAPDRSRECRTWGPVLMDAGESPEMARFIGNCEIQPPVRGAEPPGRQVWGRIPTTVVEDPAPTTPCWTFAPLYGASGEGDTRNVLCVLNE
ncbi:MAG: hypothetical protein Kow0010_13180 [Dehalococcoidia bacterium]